MKFEFAGYITSGRFAADAARFGLEMLRCDAQSPAFLERLPDDARKTVEHMVASMQEGTFYDFRRFYPVGAWGFDFKANGLEVLDADFEGDLSASVFSMAMDGSGNHHCLMDDGKVALWNHEESNIEADTQFDSLDQALCALLHRQAVGMEAISYDEVKALFHECAGAGKNGWGFLRDEMEEL